MLGPAVPVHPRSRILDKEEGIPTFPYLHFAYLFPHSAVGSNSLDVSPTENILYIKKLKWHFAIRGNVFEGWKALNFFLFEPQVLLSIPFPLLFFSIYSFSSGFFFLKIISFTPFSWA